MLGLQPSNFTLFSSPVVVHMSSVCRQHLPCGHSRGHISYSIHLKFGQNVCLDEISDKFEFGSPGSKTRSIGQIKEIPCGRSGGHISC